MWGKNDKGMNQIKEMENDVEMSLLSGLNFVFSVFLNLQRDPFCPHCRLFMKCVDTARERFLTLVTSINRRSTISEEMRRLMLDIYIMVDYLDISETSVKKEQEEHCKFLREVCLAESVMLHSRAVEFLIIGYVSLSYTAAQYDGYCGERFY